MRLCQQGRHDGFARLMQAYQGRVYRRAYSFLRHREDALDATQDVMLRVMKAIDRFRPGSPLWPWLRRITTTTCLNMIRDKSGDPPTVSWESDLESLHHTHQQSTEDLVAHIWDREALSQALLQLPPLWRVVVVLRHEEDLTYEQISDVTHLPLGTVKTYLFRARRALRQLLSNEVGA